MTLEYLKDYSSAIKSYYVEAQLADGLYDDATAAIRLADLYGSAGQLGALKEFAQHLRAGQTLKRVVELWDLDRKGDLAALRHWFLEDGIDFPRLPIGLHLPSPTF